MKNNVSVLLLSSIESSPGERREYIFNDAYHLVKNGVEAHIIRSTFEESFHIHGVSFHGLHKKNFISLAWQIFKNLRVYLSTSLFRSPSKILWENIYALNTLKVLENHNIDLIHAHFAYPEGLVGLLVKRTSKKPLIVTIHGYDLLLDPRIGYGARLNKKVDTIIRKVLNSSDAVILESHATFNEATKIVPDTTKLHLIPAGIDIERFHPALNGNPIKKKLGIERNKVVFTLRSHKPKYGLEFLIRAVPLVTKENKDIIFIIGGDGPLKSYHERLAENLKVNDKILFTGRIPHNEVPYYYALSDVVVVPSLQEAFGLVVAEALACGKPVIGTKIGGIIDQIIDGYNGFLVQPESFTEIAEKILWLINNPKKAVRMGSNGRKIVEDKFTITKKIDSMISLYETLLN